MPPMPRLAHTGVWGRAPGLKTPLSPRAGRGAGGEGSPLYNCPVIQVALSTGSLYTFGTARVFDLARDAGYDGLELMVDERWDTRQPDYLRQLIETTGLPVLSVHSPFSVLAIPGWPKVEVERIKLALEVAEAVGARTLNLHVPFRIQEAAISFQGRRWRMPLPGQSRDQRAYTEWLTGGGLAALQATTNVTITVENLPVRFILGRRFSPYALNTWQELARFPRLCLDTTHCGTTGDDLLAVYQRLAPGVAHVHLSDYTGRYQHQPVGRGQLPLKEFLHALAGHGFDGVVVVELTPHALPVQNKTRLLAELRRNLRFCREHLDATPAGPETGSEAGAPLPVMAGMAVQA